MTKKRYWFAGKERNFVSDDSVKSLKRAERGFLERQGFSAEEARRMVDEDIFLDPDQGPTRRRPVIVSDTRKRLLTIQIKGNELFHGSPLLVEMLVPKSLVNFDRETGQEFKDGNPSVAATPFVDIAIFRAIINSQNFPFGKGYSSSFGETAEGNIRLEITQKVWKNLEGKVGYVYVLSRDCFEEHPTRRWEWRCEKEVRPLRMIAVSAKDLPFEKIEVKSQI